MPCRFWWRHSKLSSLIVFGVTNSEDDKERRHYDSVPAEPARHGFFCPTSEANGLEIHKLKF